LALTSVGNLLEITNSVARAKEIEDMLRVKVELEALHCFGNDFSNILFGYLLQNAEQDLLQNAEQEKDLDESTWEDVI
jgi:hypothetical protein